MKTALSSGSAVAFLLLSSQVIIAETNYTDAELTRRLELYDVAAIKMIVNEGRTNLIPALELVANAPILAEEPSRIWARKALAKLGVKLYYDDIVRDILRPNENKLGQALDDIIYLQDPAAVKVLAPMLYESPITKPGDPSPPQSAIFVLSRLHLPDAPQFKRPIIHARQKEIEIWQRWWEEHKDYYEKVEFGKPLPPREFPAPTSAPKTQSNPVSPPRTPQSPASESAAPSASWLYPLIIIGVVLGGLVAWLLVRRRGKS
ncbi:MAG: hypothetical protein PCFJNLEI_02330 [Verrucomicrobiae bacterium]|nr:hypothetical protein [Verrucomicrobiae bacterium]